MARRRRKARATALLGQGLATESRLASLIQQPLRGPQPQRADTRVERGAPNQVWVADITYIPTDEGWLFLAAIKDLHTCEIVGWAMDSRMTKTLVIDALRAAYWRKKPKPGLMHHSDRGSQYCSAAYRALQARYGMTTSMSRKGNCWDNAPMESFFGTLTQETLDLSIAHIDFMRVLSHILSPYLETPE